MRIFAVPENADVEDVNCVCVPMCMIIWSSGLRFWVARITLLHFIVIFTLLCILSSELQSPVKISGEECAYLLIQARYS